MVAHCKHEWEPDTLMTKMRCEKCGEDAPRRTFADTCLELTEKAIESPWAWEKEMFGWKALNAKGRKDKDGEQARVIYARNDGLMGICHSDAEFIAASRTLVPELARRLKKACEALRNPGAYSAELADELEAPLGDE